ncbi:hypothetical protein C8Q80DRAFT_165062 [Daedaleopsis nitida]|nr:hypothetical protein C8Q80DRAFT_165062 [Daedaleopsis nitida]
MSGHDYQNKQLSVSPPSPNDSTLAYMAMASDHESDHDHDLPRSALLNGVHPSSPRVESHASDRTLLPIRAATLDSPHDLDQRKPRTDEYPHARSEDLNHSSSWNSADPQFTDRVLSQSPAPPFRAASRPSTPGSSNHHHSDYSGSPRRPRSAHSDSSLNSDPSTPGGSQPGGTSTTHTSTTSVAST